MGKKKQKQQKWLLLGAVYKVDKRYTTIDLFKKILSRQYSKNVGTRGNYYWFDVEKTPVNTTMMVLSHKIFYGREYVRVLISDSNNNQTIGHLSIHNFLRSICGDPQWIPVPDPLFEVSQEQNGDKETSK